MGRGWIARGWAGCERCAEGEEVEEDEDAWGPGGEDVWDGALLVEGGELGREEGLCS